MSNWTTITEDILKAAGHSAIITAADTAGIGGDNPVAETIAGAVARVRRAVAAGNDLDTNTAAVPNSLRAVTIRLAVFALMERIQYPLTEDQRATRQTDNSDLLRIHDTQMRVEAPDNPGGGAEMQSQPLPRIIPRPRQFDARDENGA